MTRTIITAVALSGAMLAAMAGAQAATPTRDGDAPACSARVLKIEDTGWALNDHNFARMTLRVTPPHGRAFVTTIEREVSNHAPPHAGSTLRVTCDPANPTDIHPYPAG